MRQLTHEMRMVNAIREMMGMGHLYAPPGSGETRTECERMCDHLADFIGDGCSRASTVGSYVGGNG